MKLWGEATRRRAAGWRSGLVFGLLILAGCAQSACDRGGTAGAGRFACDPGARDLEAVYGTNAETEAPPAQ